MACGCSGKNRTPAETLALQKAAESRRRLQRERQETRKKQLEARHAR